MKKNFPSWNLEVVWTIFLLFNFWAVDTLWEGMKLANILSERHKCRKGDIGSFREGTMPLDHPRSLLLHLSLKKSVSCATKRVSKKGKSDKAIEHLQWPFLMKRWKTSFNEPQFFNRSVFILEPHLITLGWTLCSVY